jgi:hypothetical protein
MPAKGTSRKEWVNDWVEEAEDVQEKWQTDPDFIKTRLIGLMNTQEAQRHYELKIINGKPLPYVRGTFANIWDQMSPGDSFHVTDDSQRKAALVSAKRKKVKATSEKENKGWRVWLVSKDWHPEIEKEIKPNRTKCPRTKAKEFTMGDGPAKYVYASDMAVLECELQEVKCQLARENKKNQTMEPIQVSLEFAIEFIKTLTKNKDDDVAKAASIWLRTHKLYG